MHSIAHAEVVVNHSSKLLCTLIADKLRLHLLAGGLQVCPRSISGTSTIASSSAPRRQILPRLPKILRHSSCAAAAPPRFGLPRNGCVLDVHAAAIWSASSSIYILRSNIDCGAAVTSTGHGVHTECQPSAAACCVCQSGTRTRGMGRPCAGGSLEGRDDAVPTCD